MKRILFLFYILSSFSIYAQIEAQDKTAIRAVMKAQEVAWSQNNLEEFMQGYWKSDSLKFYGAS